MFRPEHLRGHDRPSRRARAAGRRGVAVARLDFALAALALAEAGARLLGQPAAPAWRARAEERFDAAERAGVTDAALTRMLRDHGQVA